MFVSRNAQQVGDDRTFNIILFSLFGGISVIGWHVDAAKLDCRDIVNKLNEVGVDCPIFVARYVSKLPLATPDAFDLAKLSKDMSDVLRIEESVVTSFAALSCLQNEFKSVLNKCEQIDSIAEQITDIKAAVTRKNNRRIIESDISESDTQPPAHTDVSVVDYETDDEDGAVSIERERDVTVPTHVVGPRVTTGLTVPNSTNNVDVHVADEEPAVLRLRDGPQKTSWMTDGGFNVVNRNNQRAERDASYSDRVKSHKSLFINSSRQRSNNVTLKAVRFKPYASHNKNDGYNRRNNKDCMVFISRLDPDTTVQHVTKYLKSKYNKHFRVEQIKAKYDTYASFKVCVPQSMKTDLLNKYNWDKAGDVYVREFIEKRSYY